MAERRFDEPGRGTFPTGLVRVRTTTQPATDLDLAVLLVNTDDRLEDPSDRLNDVRWFRSAAHPGRALAARPRDQADADLDRLRVLRADLRSAFEADDVGVAGRVLNRGSSRLGRCRSWWLTPAQARSGMTVDPSPPRRRCARGAATGSGGPAHRGTTAPRRLGICSSDPCRCAFVDRTRGGTRRYCCSWCNDRAAAGPTDNVDAARCGAEWS